MNYKDWYHYYKFKIKRWFQLRYFPQTLQTIKPNPDFYVDVDNMKSWLTPLMNYPMDGLLHVLQETQLHNKGYHYGTIMLVKHLKSHGAASVN